MISHKYFLKEYLRPMCLHERTLLLSFKEEKNSSLTQTVSKNDPTVIIKPDKDNTISKIEGPISLMIIDAINKQINK